MCILYTYTKEQGSIDVHIRMYVYGYTYDIENLCKEPKKVLGLVGRGPAGPSRGCAAHRPSFDYHHHHVCRFVQSGPVL